MPPQVRITKEQIVKTAIALIKREGADAVNARVIAKELGCSTQPVFSNFATMEALRRAVLSAANTVYQAYIDREITTGVYPAYKASGMAYIRFAREEKELFKLLFMRDRSAEPDEPEPEETQRLYAMVRAGTGLEGDTARLFHLEMWAFVHGIAAITATGYLALDTALISDMLSDAYQGIKLRYESKEAQRWTRSKRFL